MCTRAAWPGRSWEKDDNLQHHFLKKLQNEEVYVKLLMCESISALTSFGLEVWDAVQDHMVKEQGFVVDLDMSREQATEVLHIPEQDK